jgi:hypothetical protein
MAKEKKSAADLDAELAALEAELAALEGKAKAKPAKKAAPAPPAAAPVEKRSRFALGKKKEEPAAPAPAPAPKEKRAFGFGKIGKKTAPEPQPRPAAYDASAWRHEEGAWVRVNARETPVVRRILDEDDNVVREEYASRADLERNDAVKAERGARRLFGRNG